MFGNVYMWVNEHLIYNNLIFNIQKILVEESSFKNRSFLNFRLIAMLILVFSMVILPLAMPGIGIKTAHANAPFPSWWHGQTCDTNNYPGSYPLGASYNGVIACGPGPTQGGSDHSVQFFSGAWTEYEWECTELVFRYMYLVDGIAPYSANGKDVVNNYSGNILTKVSNNGTSLPIPGDIISQAARREIHYFYYKLRG